MEFIKRKLELLLISKSRVSVKHCMLKHIFKDKKDPVIIFYHYNTVNEPYADWWKKMKRMLFMK